MEDISPLFAIQAEKALQANNPQLALEICRRGIQFFPDYEIGYVLMAEAYEMMGNHTERDKIIEEIQKKFPNAITTKAIEQKIKSEGSLLKDYNEGIDLSSSDAKLETIENSLEYESQVLSEEDIVRDEFGEIAQEGETLSSIDTLVINSIDETELPNVDELIGEAQSVIADIEETIQDLEDELNQKTEIEWSEEIIMSETSTENDEEIIQEYAEMESEISDLRDFATVNQDPDLVVEFSDELVELESDELTFEDEVDELQTPPVNIIDFKDIDLIPGINFLPFKFDYEEIILASQDVTLEKYTQSAEIPTSQEIDPKQSDTSNLGDDKINLQSTAYFNPEPVTEDLQSENSKEDYSEDFIPTETLAMIYEKQGKYLQAIEIYQKLMEIHPEKMEHYLNKIMLLETDGN